MICMRRFDRAGRSPEGFPGRCPGTRRAL